MKPTQYYLDRMPTWFLEDLKSIDYLMFYIKLLQDYMKACDDILDGINLNNAKGKQLDLIGNILNLGRSFPIPDLPGYDGKLDDVHYRRLIKGNIASRRWDGSRYGLEKALKEVYGSDVTFTIDDNMNLSYVVYATGVENVSTDPNTYTPNPIDVALITSGRYAPKPMGIEVTYSVIDNPIFTYDTKNNVFKAGWDVGAWFKEVSK